MYLIERGSVIVKCLPFHFIPKKILEEFHTLNFIELLCFKSEMRAQEDDEQTNRSLICLMNACWFLSTGTVFPASLTLPALTASREVFEGGR
mgnify:CR=1 FL=1